MAMRLTGRKKLLRLAPYLWCKKVGRAVTIPTKELVETYLGTYLQPHTYRCT
jgi:hypothetical protein